MSSAPDVNAGPPGDLLDRPDAGDKAIRGGAYRLIAYGLGVILSLGSAPLLIRHLGVLDFGRYVTVSSLVAVVALVADAGLTVVGLREYATRDEDGRRSVMGTIMLMRVVIAAIGTVVALLFALVAGYTGVMIAGTAIGCLALGFTLIQQSATIPLQSELRFGATSILELVRAATAAVGIVALVIVGASLFDFLIWPLPVALTVLAATLLIMRRRGELLPRYRRDELRYIGRETLPAAASSVLNSVFYRVSIIVMSIVASGRELGYYSASYRVIESLIIVPSLLVGTAFPIMARAAETDLVRLRYILQRLFDVGALLGIGTALMLVVGAPSAIYVLAGPDFNPAIPALRLQGLAMGASFLVPVWAGALWNLRLRGPLVIANLVGLVAAIVFVFIGAQQGATGTAIGATAAEFVYVGALWTALVRSRPDLGVGLAVPPRALLAAIVAAAALLVPVPHAVQIPIAGVIYLVVLFATRAVPPELLAALRTRRLVE